MATRLELLAPAGSWPALEAAVAAGADAVYLGDKRFNMRLLRPHMNFSGQEFKEAVRYCHEAGVKVYVTVNNMYFESELAPLTEYLCELEQIGVDAIIVQDLAVAELCRDHNLTMPLHASVQMGISNLESARLIESSGITRAILSRNLSLQEIKDIHEGCGLELESFVHGELCISHSGQCTMSGLLFSESGNRGRCRKPCRWPYRISGSGEFISDEYQYWLAYHDLCMYPHLQDLINAGVISFKIEGRQRDPEYIAMLVSIYRRALDNLTSELENDQADWNLLFQNRRRDFSTGCFYGATILDDIGLSGEREPNFPTRPIKIKTLNHSDYREYQPENRLRPELAVRVGSRAGVEASLQLGVKNIILSTEFIRSRHEGFSSLHDLEQAIAEVVEAGAAAVLELPRIVTCKDRPRAEKLLELAAAAGIKTIIAHEPGSLKQAVDRGMNCRAGIGFNLCNSKAVAWVASWGATAAAVSPEVAYHELKEMASRSVLPLEIQVHGSLCGMISDLNYVETLGNEAAALELVDKYGQKYPIYADGTGRNHIYHPLDQALFMYLPWLMLPGIRWLTINGELYSPQLLAATIKPYRAALDDLERGIWQQQENWERLLELYPHGVFASPMFTRKSFRQENGVLVSKNQQPLPRCEVK